jgi:hypothetical protein
MEAKKEAKRNRGKIPNQVKKQTQKPTLKWVFMLMREITEVKIEVDSKVITKIANLDEVKDKIIRLMGKIVKNIIFEERSAESQIYALLVKNGNFMTIYKGFSHQNTRITILIVRML